MTEDEHKKLNVAGLWFPATMVVSVVVFFVYFTWTLASERSAVHSRIDKVSQSVETLTSTVNRLAGILERGGSNSFTRGDWKVECLQMQIANPGWTCPHADPGSPWRVQPQ